MSLVEKHRNRSANLLEAVSFVKEKPRPEANTYIAQVRIGLVVHHYDSKIRHASVQMFEHGDSGKPGQAEVDDEDVGADMRNQPNGIARAGNGAEEV